MNVRVCIVLGVLLTRVGEVIGADEEWRGPLEQLEMKVDRALRRMKESQETATKRTTTVTPQSEKRSKSQEMAAISSRLDEVQHTLEHKLLSELNALVSRLERVTKSASQEGVTVPPTVQRVTTTTDLPQRDDVDKMTPMPEKSKMKSTQAAAVGSKQGIKTPLGEASAEHRIKDSVMSHDTKSTEDAMNTLEENVRTMQHRIMRKLNHLQKAMPTDKTDACTSILVPHLDKVQEEVTKGQRALEVNVGVLRQLLNLELGVSLRAMQVDLQHCHRSTAELRDIMAETLTRRKQVERVPGRMMGYLRDGADMPMNDMSDMSMYKARDGATVVKEMALTDQLGEGIATELVLTHPRSCAEIFLKGYKRSGIYTVWPTFNSTVQLQKYAYCDMDTDGGGWTVFQRRGDFGGKQENFSRPWIDYKRGFGKVNRDFWMGNDILHVLTNQEPTRLRIELEDWSEDRRVAQYGTFGVANEADLYRLSVGNFTGDLPDSFLYHDGAAFSTIDRNNAGLISRQCVTTQGQGGGWWYNNCYRAKLNSPYKMQGSVGRAEGLQWRMWKGYEYSLKSSEMKLRPLCFPKKMC